MLVISYKDGQQHYEPLTSTDSTRVLRQVIMFNLCRLGIYTGLGSAFAMLPSSMPEHLKFGGVPSPSAEVFAPRDKVSHSVRDTLVQFSFVQWNGKDGTWAGSYVSSLSEKWRSEVMRADLWTRRGWWWWVVVATLFVGGQSGFWLGVDFEVNMGCIPMSSSIAFHFLFILTGYSLRGLRSPHVPMLKLTAVTCACVTLVGVAALVACLRDMDWVGALVMVGTSVFVGSQGNACWRASYVLQKHRNAFPRSGISHNWM